MGANTGYATGQRLLEVTALGLFGVLAACSAWRTAAAAGWYFVPLALLALPLGWLAADLLSGLLHWALDSFGSVRTPLVGRAFIRPFREHHVDPDGMTRHDFIETNGSSALACLPALVATTLMPLETTIALLFQAILLAIALGALAANQCHKWAHLDERATPRLVRWAQRRGLLLSRAEHLRHHQAPFDSHYCTASGWLNAPLDACLRAWR